MHDVATARGGRSAPAFARPAAAAAAAAAAEDRGDPARPLVSVVIPSRNRADVLGQTLDSLRGQTYPDWEAVVVDDHSTDATPQLLADAARADPRVRGWARTRPTAGAPACRNEGWLASRGSLVIFLDSDDLLAPTCMEGRVAAMAQHPEAGFAVFGTAVFVQRPGDSGVYWNAFDDRDDLDRFLLHDAPWGTTGPVWRRWALEKVGPWDESAARWQDWEFHVRALAARIPYVKVPTADSYWRCSRAGSISSTEFEPQAYASHRDLLPRVFRTIGRSPAMTPQRRRMFAALFMHLSERCYDITGDLRLSREIWAGACAAGAAGPMTGILGRCYLQAPKSDAGRRVRRHVITRLLPHLDRTGRSSTRGRAPAPAHDRFAAMCAQATAAAATAARTGIV